MDVQALSPRTRALTRTLDYRVWPTSASRRLPQLVSDPIETGSDVDRASVIATGLAIVVCLVAARADGGRVRSVVSWTARAGSLFCRAIPPPVWAPLLFVFCPGGMPGAVALGPYDLGGLGRLIADVVEAHDPRPAKGHEPSGPTVDGVVLRGPPALHHV